MSSMEQRRTLRWNGLGDAELRSEVREAIMRNLLNELLSWQGTPFMRGQRVKQKAADCVNFLAGVLDALYGFPPLKRMSMPIMPGSHSTRRSWENVRSIVTTYPNEVIRGDIIDVEPGDILVVRAGSGPGHVMIVGPEPNTLWQSIPTVGVVKTGFRQTGLNIQRAWRLLRKDTWATI